MSRKEARRTNGRFDDSSPQKYWSAKSSNSEASILKDDLKNARWMERETEGTWDAELNFEKTDFSWTPLGQKARQDPAGTFLSFWGRPCAWVPSLWRASPRPLCGRRADESRRPWPGASWRLSQARQTSQSKHGLLRRPLSEANSQLFLLQETSREL